MASQKRCVRPPNIHKKNPIDNPAPLRSGESVRASSRMSGAKSCITEKLPTRRRDYLGTQHNARKRNPSSDSGKLTRAGKPVKVAVSAGAVHEPTEQAPIRSVWEDNKFPHQRGRNNI